mgnify:CR=1 FL=1
MPMPSLSTRLPHLREDPDRSRHRLRVRPILGPSHDEPDYAVLDDATKDLVEITEIDEAGDVPTVRVHNKLDRPVLLIDSQGLVGAKQNRSMNTDVLVPANTRLDVPVSCVEQGRWQMKDAKFRTVGSGSRRVRQRKLGRVHENLKAKRGHDADQGEVWRSVKEELMSSKIKSHSSALHDVYAAKDKELAEARKSLELPEEAVGVAVFLGAELQGIDLFDRHSTLAFAWSLLVDGYAIDTLDRPVQGEAETTESPEDRAVLAVLEDAAGAAWSRFDSPGLGDDWRLEDSGYAGAALVVGDEHLVHLQVMPKAADDGGDKQ